MNLPTPHLRSSSTSISAMEGSFSLAEFGAWDMNMSTEDFEAMAAEAENVARARIGKMATMNSKIDSMCESEDDDVDGGETEHRRDARCGDRGQDDNSTHSQEESWDGSWDPRSNTSSVRSEVQDCGSPEHEENDCGHTGDESDNSIGNSFTKDDNETQQESFSSLDDPWDIAVATAPFSIPKAEEAHSLATNVSTMKHQHDEKGTMREFPKLSENSRSGKEKNVETVDTKDIASSGQNILEKVSQASLGRTSSGSTSLERSHNSSDKSPITPASPFDLRDLLDSLWTEPVLSTKSRSSSIEKVGRRASAHPVYTASSANNDQKPARRSSHKPRSTQPMNLSNGSYTSNASNVMDESKNAELSPKSPSPPGRESTHGAVVVDEKRLPKTTPRRGSSNFEKLDSQPNTQQGPLTAQPGPVCKSTSENDARNSSIQKQSGSNLHHSPSSDRDRIDTSRIAKNEKVPNHEAKQSPRTQKELPPTNSNHDHLNHPRKSRCRENPLSNSCKETCRGENERSIYNDKVKVTMGNTYVIGDNLRSKSDIIHEDSPKEAFINISKLQVFDYAFVRRSKIDQWTFSIVCKVTDDEIQFVLSKSGATKRLGRPLWVHNIRRPNPERCAIRQRHPDTSKPDEIPNKRNKKCGLHSSLPNREFLDEQNRRRDRHRRQDTQCHVRFA